MVLLIDNYDSFVHNLARYFRQLGQETRVVRNDGVSVDEVAASGALAVVLSPGPLAPEHAGVCLEVVERLAGTMPMLGVCLGHQAIGQALGGRVERAPAPIHGRATQIEHRGRDLFAGLPSPMTVGRYHSLVIDRRSLSDSLEELAWDAEGVVMAVRHRQFPVFGIQFHPESLLTPYGYHLLANFLHIAGAPAIGAARVNALAEGIQSCAPP
jgi:anthranilate synthase/aminodeoxychorismate synthase-like glutamine amidotransferase